MLSITERRQQIAVIQLLGKDNLNDKRRSYKGVQRTTNTVNDSNRSRFEINIVTVVTSLYVCDYNTFT